VGPRPNDRREPWEAAMQGNKWVLGLTVTKPEWATEFFPEKLERQTFQMEAISNKYPDAPELGDPKEEPLVAWAGPQYGWRLRDRSYVAKIEGETKEQHKGRAMDMALALEQPEEEI